MIKLLAKSYSMLPEESLEVFEQALATTSHFEPALAQFADHQ